MPGRLCPGGIRAHDSQRLERPAGRFGMTNGALTAQDLAISGGVPIIVAPEAAVPILVPEVVGMTRPVCLHLGEDQLIVECGNLAYRLIDIIVSSLTEIRITLFIKAFDRLVDPGMGLLSIWIGTTKSIRCHLFNPGQVAWDEVRCQHNVDRSIRGIEDMGRPVMAADAIEGLCSVGEVFVRCLGISYQVLFGGPIQAGDGNPGDLLFQLIIGDIFDLLHATDMVEMDTVEDLAANLHPQGDLFGRVLFIITEIGPLQKFRPKEPAGPVA